MVYACMSNKPFIVKGKVVRHRKLSREIKECFEYIESHYFAIDEDPSGEERITIGPARES